MKESWYEPQPVDAPAKYPRRIPKRGVPSYIGEANQVLDLLMHKGGGGTVKDHSGEENHGTIYGAEWTDEDLASWALRFNGVDNHVLIPDLPKFSAYTIMVLTRHHSVNDGDIDTSVAFRANNAILIRDEGDGLLYFYHRDSGATWHSGRTPISSDVWNLWTIRWDGATVTGWKNDTNPVSFPVSSIRVQGGNDNLGWHEADNKLPLNGDIALAMVYDTDKPDSFIKSVHEAVKPLYG